MFDIEFEDVVFAIVMCLIVMFALTVIDGLSRIEYPACVTHMGQVIYVDDLETYPKSGKVSYEYDGTEYYNNQATYWYVAEGQSCEQ